jgi:hypothetical protein
MELDLLWKRLDGQQSPVTSRRISMAAAESKKRGTRLVGPHFPIGQSTRSRLGCPSTRVPLGEEPVCAAGWWALIGRI